VQLLRNRVAMLQREQEKANKKIKDTGKKTDELIQRKEINDRHYNQVLTEQEQKEMIKRQQAEQNFV